MRLEKACELAEAFRESVRHLSVRYSGSALPSITVSAGVASLTDRNQQVVDLMKIADRALYQAKRNGRNTVQSQLDLEDPQTKLPNGAPHPSEKVAATALRPKAV